MTVGRKPKATFLHVVEGTFDVTDTASGSSPSRSRLAILVSHRRI